MVQIQKNGNEVDIQDGSKRNGMSVFYRIAIDDMLSTSEFNLSRPPQCICFVVSS